EGLIKNLKGTNSIGYTKTDPVALAKILTKVAKDVPAFQFRAGWVEGRVISIQEIKQLADLPSKEELISKVMFLLNAPAQRIATALAALPGNLAGLKEAKDLVDGAPKTVKEGVNKEEAATIKKKFEDAGAKVDIKKFFFQGLRG